MVLSLEKINQTIGYSGTNVRHNHCGHVFSHPAFWMELKWPGREHHFSVGVSRL